jgi:hypothetical protein
MVFPTPPIGFFIFSILSRDLVQNSNKTLLGQTPPTTCFFTSLHAASDQYDPGPSHFRFSKTCVYAFDRTSWIREGEVALLFTGTGQCKTGNTMTDCRACIGVPTRSPNVCRSERKCDRHLILELYSFYI